MDVAAHHAVKDAGHDNHPTLRSQSSSAYLWRRQLLLPLLQRIRRQRGLVTAAVVVCRAVLVGAKPLYRRVAPHLLKDIEQNVET